MLRTPPQRSKLVQQTHTSQHNGLRNITIPSGHYLPLANYFSTSFPSALLHCCRKLQPHCVSLAGAGLQDCHSRWSLPRSLSIPHGCLVGRPVVEIKSESVVQGGIKPGCKSPGFNLFCACPSLGSMVAFAGSSLASRDRILIRLTKALFLSYIDSKQ